MVWSRVIYGVLELITFFIILALLQRVLPQPIRDNSERLGEGLNAVELFRRRV
jgi:hypothetical protein